MPKTLKRRSDALNNARDDTPDDGNPPPRRRQRSASASSSAASDASGADETQPDGSSHETYVKKLVRLSLAAEYSRTPIRRGDISTKVFVGTNSRTFKRVFEDAQKILMEIFGMQLVELPTREKTSLKDRRAQATQTKAPGSTSSKAWILISILPAAYKQNPAIVQPSQAGALESESTYTALYSFILSLIYLNKGALADGKMERYLKRVNVDSYTPLGSIEKLMQRMSKEGYIEKRRDTSSGEEVVEWVAGPRGRMEVGAKGVASMVQMVYAGAGGPGQGKVEEQELASKLERSLGIKLRPERDQDEDMEEAEEPPPAQQQRRSKRAAQRDDSDDD